MKFTQRVYSLVKNIPRGKVTTYKEIAKALNSRAYRAVGTALRKNYSKDIPCHRVIKTDGFIGNYNKGIKTKIALLTKEGLKISKKKIKNRKAVFTFKQ